MFEILRRYNYWDGQEIKSGYFRGGYVERFCRYLGNKLVKVILGQRRAGKSYLLRMLMRHLIEKAGVPAENILYVNKDMAELDFIGNNSRMSPRPPGLGSE
jgi:predicted AAA+ superfamily ATPase